MPHRPAHTGAVVTFNGRRMSLAKFNRLQTGRRPANPMSNPPTAQPATQPASQPPAIDPAKFESDFWGSCCNTYDEETKHFVYADLMGIPRIQGGPRLDEWGFDTRGKSILDIGGGPVSMLLKGVGLKGGIVVDPLSFPAWVQDRYESKRIVYITSKAEMLWDNPIQREPYDECWIYNVLQHVDDPALIIRSARRDAKLIRLFEWIDIPAYPGHPQMLTKEKLEGWLGGTGKTEYLARSGCHGRCFYGVWGA